MISLIRTVFLKEIKDMIRDRRMLMAAFSFALTTPFIILVITFLLRDTASPYDLTPVAVAGKQHAPGLVTHLQNQGFSIMQIDDPGDLSGRDVLIPPEANGLLVIPDDFQDSIGRGEPVRLQYFVSETSQVKARRSAELQKAIEGYGQLIATGRLLARGVPPQLAAPILFAKRDVAEDSLFRQIITDGFVILFILAPFASSMSVAIDTLAGERERQSLQTLMAQPVSAWALVYGKFLMVVAFGLTGSLLSVVSMSLTLGFIPDDAIPLSINASPLTVVFILVQLLPYVMLVAALQLFVSIQVKSFKEGQSYMSLVMFVPILIAYVKLYGSDKLPEFAQYLPVLSNMAGLSALLFKDEFLVLHMLASAGVALLGIVIFLYFTGRQLSHERLFDG